MCMSILCTPLHTPARAERWLGRRRGQLRLRFPPGYSLDRDPDELLNQDVKTDAAGRKRPRNPAELMGNEHRFLRSTQWRPEKVRSYFTPPECSLRLLRCQTSPAPGDICRAQIVNIPG